VQNTMPSRRRVRRTSPRQVPVGQAAGRGPRAARPIHKRAPSRPRARGRVVHGRPSRRCATYRSLAAADNARQASETRSAALAMSASGMFRSPPPDRPGWNLPDALPVLGRTKRSDAHGEERRALMCSPWQRYGTAAFVESRSRRRPAPPAVAPESGGSGIGGTHTASCRAGLPSAQWSP